MLYNEAIAYNQASFDYLGALEIRVPRNINSFNFK
jgi:hypothetical protein